ncbi:hypothetical protein [Novosphingobium sp. PC22D]|uniref:hypothetical protein n=1 Tax=Novosphingobium sp. PC22D TaxID=1962403 RepID=UPI000BF20D17|nr:hypothetical protein [Novosphingobium sp. PC22D]
MQSVAGGTRNIRITVSRECFALLAEAMCEFSKTTSRFRSLRSTVQHACERAKSLTFAREDVERFLSRYPLDGQISIWLEVKPDWIEDYDWIRHKIADTCGKVMHDRVVIAFVVWLARTNNQF